MISEGKLCGSMILAVVMGMLLLCMGPISAASAAEKAAGQKAIIKVNGEIAKLNDPVYIFDGRIYAPAARVAGLLGAVSEWDQVNDELTIHTALGDDIVLGEGVPVVYFNEARYRMEALPIMKDGRMYIALRELTDMLHAGLNYDSAADTVDLSAVQPAIVTEENGLNDIAKQFGSSAAELLKRNGLESGAALKAGTKLKVVVPSFFGHPANPYTESDLKLLAKITMVEAGYESYEGQLALANVILNRVASSSFPDTIRDVIYSGRQFPPAHNGLLDKSKPNASSLRAAKDALNGKNNIGDAVYFYNPAVSRGPFWSSLETVDTIGHHRFAK